mgnify:CR=1 FL=1
MVCLLLLKFLESSLQFRNFVPGPWKTPGKTDNFLVLLEFFISFINKPIPAEASNSWLYFQVISATVAAPKIQSNKIQISILCRLNFRCCYCGRNYLISFCIYWETIWGWVLKKQFVYLFTLDKSWKTSSLYIIYIIKSLNL